jgi:hypothetical protein
MADNLRLLVERVNLRIQLLSLVFVIVGFASMFASSSVETAGYHKSASLLHEGGAALVISGALAALWELAGKRAFADEVLAKASMSRDLADAGIDIVTYSFKDDRISWEQLFKNACRLDVFVSYAHTWRNTQVERLDKLLTDSNASLRVVLPDPDNEDVLASLADRFEMEADDVRRSIDEGKGFFEHRKKKAKGTVEIYFSSIVPLFSFYRFNNKAVLALYNHRRGRLPVPSFVCDSEGFLFKYITDELEGILADKQRTRRVDVEEADASGPS